MRTLKVKSVVTRRGFFVFTNCWHSRRGSRETEGESIGGQHFTQRERERERERERKRKREREKERERDRVESMRRDARARRALPLVRSRWCRREKTRRQHARAVQVFGEIESPKEREREREPAECPTATAYLDRPVREQVILQILQNVTQTHAIATSKTLSLRSQSARVKLVPVQRRALERKGTRGNTF